MSQNPDQIKPEAAKNSPKLGRFKASVSSAVSAVRRAKRWLDDKQDEADVWVHEHLPDVVKRNPTFFTSVLRFVSIGGILASGYVNDASARMVGAALAKKAQGFGLFSKGKEVPPQGEDAETLPQHLWKQLKRLKNPLQNARVSQGLIITAVGAAYLDSAFHSGRVFEGVRSVAAIAGGVFSMGIIRGDLPWRKKQAQANDQSLSFSHSTSNPVGMVDADGQPVVPSTNGRMQEAWQKSQRWAAAALEPV